MSSQPALEAARQELSEDPHMAPSRVLGYANLLVLRVDHLPGRLPDPIVNDIDPLARRLLDPPAEEHPTSPSIDPAPTIDRNGSAAEPTASADSVH